MKSKLWKSLLSLCMFPDFNLCFWAKNWVEMRPRISASDFCNSCRSRTSRISVIHAIVSLSIFRTMSARQPRIRVVRVASNPRGHVRHVIASLWFLPFHAVVWAMRPRDFSLVISSIPCVPSIFACFLFIPYAIPALWSLKYLTHRSRHRMVRRKIKIYN